MAKRDRDRGLEALAILPVVEGREGIAARVGRGQQDDTHTADRQVDWPDGDVFTYGQRASRKLNEEAAVRVLVVIDAAVEAGTSHGGVKRAPRGRSPKNEVEVLGLVVPA